MVVGCAVSHSLCYNVNCVLKSVVLLFGNRGATLRGSTQAAYMIWCASVSYV